MLDRLAPLAHGFGILIEPPLHGFDHVLMLPACDPALLARRAAVLERTGPACVGPIAAQVQAVFDAREAVLQPLAGRAAIDILLGQIGEVLLSEATIGLGA